MTTYRDNIPFFEKGLPLPRVIFSGGRVAAELAGHGGLMSISYFGPSPGSERFFKADPLSVWNQLFRPYIFVNDDLYYAEFNHTTIHPYGYESHFSVAGVAVRHRLTLLNDALCFSFQVLEKGKGDTVRAKLVLMSEVAEVTGPDRKWTPFSYSKRDHAVTASVADTRPEVEHSVLQSGVDGNAKPMLTQCPFPGYEPLKRGTTLIGLTSDHALEYAFCQRLGKSHMRTAPIEEEANIVLLFGSEKEEFQRRLQHLAGSAGKERDDCIRCHAEKIRRQPVFELENKTLQSMLSCFPSIVESVRVKDIPGGMRAADSTYWIWGWDSMVHSDANMLANDGDFVADMLRFFKNTSHPDHGIFHMLSRDGKPAMPMAPAAQCLYVIMLHRHYVFSRDRKILEELYPFAAKLIRKAMASEVRDTGLIEGISLYPDIPEDLGQDGKDISVFNNGIFYQAMRCAEELAGVVGNHEDSRLFRSHALKCRLSFDKYFFDPEKGYYVDSVSAGDFSKRRHYPVYAVLWLTHFAKELVEHRISDIAEFMRKNFPHRFGQSMFPRWDTCVEVKGNQLGFTVPHHESYYIPVVEGFYREMQRLSGVVETTLPEIMETSWRQISIPEGIDCEAINNGIVLNYPGQKQVFCLKVWYSLFFRNLLGLEFRLDGLSVSAPLLQDSHIEVTNVRMGDRKLNVTIQGSGHALSCVTLNGRTLEGNFIAFEQLEPENHLMISRT